jgi:uncharacterized protein with FMN-binding domain
MARKLNKNLVALGSAAIVTVYAAGLARTNSAIVEEVPSTPAAAPSGDAATVAQAAVPAATPSPTTERTRRVREDDDDDEDERDRGRFVAAPATAGAVAPRQAAPPPAPTRAPVAAAPVAPPAPVTAAPVTALRDGVFAGAGTSRFGGFEVAVTVAGGRITNVEITRATTKYPASRVAQLPGQVVARQSAAVDLVSGATYSARAFRDAVAQAIALAATPAGA